MNREEAYLGHLITSEGVEPTIDQIIALKNYHLPSTKKETRAFTGLLGYNKKCIPNFPHFSQEFRMYAHVSAVNKDRSDVKADTGVKHFCIQVERNTFLSVAVKPHAVFFRSPDSPNNSVQHFL